MNKSNLIFLIEDTNGNKYGYYLPTTITQYQSYAKSKESFLFTLKSNGRINGMMKFEIKNTSQTFLLYNNNSSLFHFGCGGDLCLYKQSDKT